MRGPIKCIYCGREFPPTKKDRPRQHRNDTTTCPGSGMTRAVHDTQRALIAKARGAKS